MLTEGGCCTWVHEKKCPDLPSSSLPKLLGAHTQLPAARGRPENSVVVHHSSFLTSVMAWWPRMFCLRAPCKVASAIISCLPPAACAGWEQVLAISPDPFLRGSMKSTNTRGIKAGDKFSG